MFTMAKIRDGSTYLSNHLSANDYYAEGERVSGVWTGRGADRMGLADIVKPEQFEALRMNRRPGTVESLTPRTKGQRVAFFDFQCSAQKSVSILAMLAGDERLRVAHEQAARTAFGELEQFAARQKNTLLTRHSEITGNVCAAAFTHDASRALDPQLHTHFVVANATCAGNGRWFALNEFEMVKAIRYAGKVYQNDLARRVKLLGYGIRETRNEKGEVIGFEIEGVSDTLCALFAKRRAEIELGMELFRAKHGREPTTTEVGQITRETRSAKLSEISTPAVREQQVGQLTPEEWEQLRALKERAFANAQRRISGESDGLETEALQAGVDHLFERRSVAKEHEILAEALNQALGALDLETLKTKFARGDAGVVRLTSDAALQSECATRRGLQLEQWAVAFVNATKATLPPLNPGFETGETLSAEQRDAVRAILSTKDRVFSFRGVAGSGKTTTLREVQRGLTAYHVHYIAPTAAAAKVLQGEGFSNATTADDFLQNVAKREALHDAVVICDEAGLQSNRQGAELLRLAQQHRMRVLLVGDVRQHVSVEAGDFLRVLETHSRLGRCEVTEIRRQQFAPEYKTAIRRMAAGDALRGLEAMDEMGWLREGADYFESAASDFLRLSKGREPGSCLAVAPTWQENYRLTDAIRAGLKTSGHLPREAPNCKVFDSLRWTVQQKRNPRNFAPGQRIVFARTVGKWKSGDVAEVRRVEDRQIIVAAADGEERKLSPTAATAFDVGRLRSIEIAAGDRVLIRANRKPLGLINGQVLTVDRIGTDGSIATKEGLKIPAGFRQWCHGYVVTSHKAQGRTCDHVVVAAERLDAKAAYVACSRGRKSCAVHTPDKMRLLERLPEGSRKAALDVLAEKRRTIPIAVARRAPVWMRLFARAVTRKLANVRSTIHRLMEQTRCIALRGAQFARQRRAIQQRHASRMNSQNEIKTASRHAQIQRTKTRQPIN